MNRTLDFAIPIGIVFLVMKSAREAILKSAMRLFAEKGYASCSIREICQSAGVTKPVLYYHFQNKEDLYQELMLDIFSQTQKNLQRISRFNGPLRDRLILYVSSELRTCQKDPNSLRLLFRMMFSPEGEYPHFNFVEEFQKERKAIAAHIKQQDSEECQANPELVSTALMGMMLITILEYLFTGRRTLTQGNAEQLVDLLLSSTIPSEKNIPIGKAKRSRQ
jgi:TetR/AcrR family transcriptional regulator